MLEIVFLVSLESSSVRRVGCMDWFHERFGLGVQKVLEY
jgi:hypothetical protein